MQLLLVRSKIYASEDEKTCVILDTVEVLEMFIIRITYYVFKATSYRSIDFGCAPCIKSTSVQLNVTTRPKWIGMLQSAS